VDIIVNIGRGGRGEGFSTLGRSSRGRTLLRGPFLIQQHTMREEATGVVFHIHPRRRDILCGLIHT